VARETPSTTIDSQSPPPAAGKAADLSRYEALLAESRRIKGVSLWRDAWHRLRRNIAAMASLGLLIVIALAAFFTPFLPLQSPMQQIADNQHIYQPPNARNVRLPYNYRSVQQFEEEVRGLRQRLRGAEAAGAWAERDDLESQVASRERSHPFNQLWNNPGPLARMMIRARFMVFDDRCIPSICGRDELGRDVLSRIFWGARVSLIVGIVATLVSLVIGVSYGAISGYAGGIVDSAMMRVVDILYSVPFIFVVIFLITVLSEDAIKARLASYGINQIMIFYVVIGAIYWLTMARVVRGQIISLKHEQFVDAARTIGASGGRIVFRHLVPNVLGVVIVYLTLTIPSVMLFEAFLSFLGLGVQPPDVSWGLLMQEGIKVITPVKVNWWLVLFPGLALAATLFALNFLGDGLRDALDPRMKNR
jgi:oligopeptide transport system permease protein